MAREYHMSPPPGGAKSTGFNDETKMPFGKHKGKRLADVPPDWLLWAWDEFLHQEPSKPLSMYVKKNFKRLEDTARDYIPDIGKRPAR